MSGSVGRFVVSFNMSETTPSDNTLTLREKIEAWSTEHAADFPPEIQQLFAEKTEEILKSDILGNSIREGERSPDFTLPTTKGLAVNLNEQVHSGPVILSFYRGTWCPYCNLEFDELLRSIPRIRNVGASILAVSPQVIDRREDDFAEGFLDLCDRGNQVARQFGLVYPLGDRIREVYEQFGIRLEELNEDSSYEVPVPATYLIDGDLQVRYVGANADISQRAEPRELFERLKEIA